MIYKLTRSSPIPTSRPVVREPAPSAAPITPDEAVAIARVHVPGPVPHRVQMPNYGGVYVVALLYPQDTVAGGDNLVALDPYDGNVVSLSRSSDLSRGDRLLALNEAIHTESILGMPSRIAAWLANTTVIVQLCSGLLIWLSGNRIMLGSRRSTKEESVP
jgi:uncharacterized iron-regulated membrane protein